MTHNKGLQGHPKEGESVVPISENEEMRKIEIFAVLY
jgi:hypothetical protein